MAHRQGWAWGFGRTSAVQRIIEYPALGFAITQPVPHDVETAYKRLIAAGFDSRLLRN